LEGLVYGAICAVLASEEAERMPDTFAVPRIEADFARIPMADWT
jgi:hypothetical protein